jgi:hypothetical protein
MIWCRQACRRHANGVTGGRVRGLGFAPCTVPQDEAGSLGAGRIRGLGPRKSTVREAMTIRGFNPAP